MAVIITAAVLTTGGVITGVAVNTFNAETAALCVAAIDARTDAFAAADASVEAAEAAVAVTDAPFELNDLAGGAGATTLYVDRPAADAVEAVAKTDTTAAVPAVGARQSGKDFIADVTDAQKTLVDAAIPDDCTDRDQAAAITEAIEQSAAAVVVLDDAVEALKAAAEEAARQAEQDSWDGGSGSGGGGSNSGGGGGGLIVPPNGGGGCPPGTTFIGEGCA